MNLKQNYTEFYYKVGNSVIVLLFCKFVPFSTAVNQILKTWLRMHFAFRNIKSNYRLLSPPLHYWHHQNRRFGQLTNMESGSCWVEAAASSLVMSTHPIQYVVFITFHFHLDSQRVKKTRLQRVQDCNFERSWVSAGGIMQ